jgi:hypothetical protein
MIILQHFIQSLELKAADAEVKKGTYILRIFPELGPLNEYAPQKSHSQMPEGSGSRVVLTDNGMVRQFDEKAPRVGLEPTTNRLTAGCSTIELSGKLPARPHSRIKGRLGRFLFIDNAWAARKMSLKIGAVRSGRVARHVAIVPAEICRFIVASENGVWYLDVLITMVKRKCLKERTTCD